MSCLEIAIKLNYLKEEDYERLIIDSDEIAAMIAGFSKQL
jgi:four helix bundle protein